MKPPYPYAHAPRLPEAGPIDLRALVTAGAGGVELEVGSGRGGFVFERLRVAPDIGMVGLEVRRKWATIVDDRLRAEGLGERARIFAEDARLVMPRIVDASVAHISVHFPDPWWKKRHEKRRVLTPEFFVESARVLRPGGWILVQTDVPERAESYAQLLEGTPGLSVTERGPWLSENPFQARSPREHRAIHDGYPILRLLYTRS